MIPLDYAAHALGAARVDCQACDSSILDSLGNSGTLVGFWGSGWAAPDGVLCRRFTTTVATFIADQRDTLAGYLHSEISFPALTRMFIACAFACSLEPLSPRACLNELAAQQRAIQTQVEAVLARCLRARPVLRILGFGAGGCEFEEHIGQFAVAQGLADRVVIYRYDPFARPQSGVTDITRPQLHDSTFDLPIDMVTCRWSLHHVEPPDRWADLHACVGRLGSEAHLIAVEEGDFTRCADRRLEQRVYRFLLMAVDVVVNMTLRPAWFTCTAPEIGANFYVDYLDTSDFNSIESAFTRPFHRALYQIRDSRRAGQTVLAWHVDH